MRPRWRGSSNGAGLGAKYDVPVVWGEYASDVRGVALDCGHFLPEEAPDATASAIAQFLG